MSAANPTQKTTVVCVRKAELKKRGYRDFEHWNESKDHVYIGRNMSFYIHGASKSKWHNPYSVKKYGLEKCLELYKTYLLNNEELMSQLDQLRHKKLGCWCKPFSPCHGDILAELVN